jgi:ArsR family transcriptional regulator, arsenate/arsenite/antimonite-responsive transcriptional repressor
MTSPFLARGLLSVRAVGLAESTVSHHLSQLRHAGLLDSDRRGMDVCYRPRHDTLVALCSVLDSSCCT